MQLKTKLTLGSLSILIAAMFLSTTAVSVIIRKQNRETSHDILKKSLNIVVQEILEKQEDFLSYSRQMATENDIGSNIQYLGESKSEVEYSITKLAYENMSVGIYKIALNADVWKAAVYDLDGKMTTFFIAQNDNVRLGYVHLLPCVIWEVATLKRGTKLDNGAWKSRDAFPDIQSDFAGNIPEQEIVRFEVIDHFLCLVSYIPIMGEIYNVHTADTEPKQFGVLMASMKIDTAFVEKMSGLTGTALNIFTRKGFSVGKNRAYKTYNLGIFGNSGSEWRITDQEILFSDIKLNKENYFQGVLPVYTDTECIAALVSLYSKAIAEANAWQMIRLMLIIGIITIILGFLMATFISRSISRPVSNLADKASHISIHLDLNQRIEFQSSDEVGVLASAFNSMIESLKDYYEELQKEIAERGKAEEKYRSIFENATEGIFQSTPDGRFLSANPAMAHILGYSSPDELVESVTDIGSQLYVNPDHREAIFRLTEKHKTVLGFETRVCRKDGSRVWVSLNVRPVRNENGNLLFVEGMAEEIEQRKEAEALRQAYLERVEKEVKERTRELSKTLEDLRATQAQLVQSEKMAALGQLIAGVAHEINTPLGAIRASAGNISDSLSETLEHFPRLLGILSRDECKDFFALLRRAGKNKDDISAREARKLKRALSRRLEEYDLSDADDTADTLTDMKVYDNIDEFLHLLRHPENDLILKTAYNLSSLQRGAKTITTATDRASKTVFALKSYARFDAGGEPVCSDLTQGIETVLTLYHNQFKHGVEVIRNYEDLPAIPCHPDELNQVWTNLIHNAIQAMEGSGSLEICVRQKDEHAVVTFTDSGKGIPDEIKDRIFEPFFTTKPAGEGSGLGLDIVRKIIDKHNGKIDAESEPGRTVFRVSIPFSAPHEHG